MKLQSNSMDGLSPDNPPFYLVIGPRSSLGNPKGITASDNTIDISFVEFANSYEIQKRLELMSALFVRPAFKTPGSRPLQGNNLIEKVADYISNFEHDSIKQRQNRDYLLNNGIVRILIEDFSLLQDIKRIRQSQANAYAQEK